MGRKTIGQQISHLYHDKIAFRESRHLAKQALREQYGKDYKFSMTDDKIHAVRTFETYSKVGKEYALWLTSVKEINKYTRIEGTEHFAKEYIEWRLEKGVSLWTAKMERAALGKLYGKTIEMEMPERNRDDIKRSRNECAHDKHFSKENHKEEILVASATGTRREDLAKITLSSFEEHNNILYVRINGSKGGRNRLAPVLPSKETELRELLDTMRQNGKREKEPLFEYIPKNMDVHSYRRTYAKDLFQYVDNHKEYKEKVLNQYPERHEYRVIKDKETGERKVHEIQSEYYKPRGDEKSYSRDSLYIVSQGLGHNRIDVTYLYIR